MYMPIYGEYVCGDFEGLFVSVAGQGPIARARGVQRPRRSVDGLQEFEFTKFYVVDISFFSKVTCIKMIK
jgi:hypothetical protein